MDSYQGSRSIVSNNQTLKPIETKITIERESKGGGGGQPNTAANGERTMEEEEPSSPGTRLFHSLRFNCCIIAIFGFQTEFNVNSGKVKLEHALLKHPRFTSVLAVNGKKGGEMRWIKTKVNFENHFIVPNLNPVMDSPDQFVEDYISDLTKTSLDLSKPLWEFHVLNVKTSDANSIGVFRIHHSLGDGASLISLLLACSRKTSNPEALPTIPTQSQAGSSDSSGNWRFLFAIWLALRLIWNTFVDVILFMAMLLFLKDTKTPIKGTPGTELTPKRFVHLTIGLDDIKLVKNAMNVTINDVLLGLTQAGLSRYLNRRYCEGENKDDGAMEKKSNLPKRIRLRATVAYNIRPSAGIEGLADMMEKGSKVKYWGNWFGYVLLPFKIALRDDPLDYICQAKAMMDRKKHSLEAICTFSSTKLILRSFGVEAAAALCRKALYNTTMSFSNVIGPQEEISFVGHPVAFLAPTAYGLPHALTIHFQSYANKMTIVLAVDQVVIPDPHQLCNDLGESLKFIKNAVLERGLIKNGAY